jgi:hypothetical protein
MRLRSAGQEGIHVARTSEAQAVALSARVLLVPLGLETLPQVVTNQLCGAATPGKIAAVWPDLKSWKEHAR